MSTDDLDGEVDRKSVKKHTRAVNASYWQSSIGERTASMVDEAKEDLNNPKEITIVVEVKE